MLGRLRRPLMSGAARRRRRPDRPTTSKNSHIVEIPYSGLGGGSLCHCFSAPTRLTSMRRVYRYVWGWDVKALSKAAHVAFFEYRFHKSSDHSSSHMYSLRQRMRSRSRSPLKKKPAAPVLQPVPPERTESLSKRRRHPISPIVAAPNAPSGYRSTSLALPYSEPAVDEPSSRSSSDRDSPVEVATSPSMSSVSIPASPTTPASNKSTELFDSRFGRTQTSSEYERERLLKALSEPMPTGPLAPNISSYFHTAGCKPKWARYSVDMGRRINTDCVLAAFASARGDMPGFHLTADRNTSTDEAIKKIASAYGMKKIRPNSLRNHLKTIDMGANNIAAHIEHGSPRAFIQAPALGGNAGRYHAYAAFGFDSKINKVIAWDPDKSEYERTGNVGIRGVPDALIELAFI